jgi:Cu-Zn family superoxide dismutase
MKIWVWAALGATAITACGNEANGSDASDTTVETTTVSSTQQDDRRTGRSMATRNPDMDADMSADIIGTDGDTIGTAMLRNGPHGMIIRVDADGIADGWHAAHLHGVGDCSDPEAGFKASGSHINVDDRKHGLLNPEGFHTGADFPNLYASGDSVRGELFAVDLLMSDAMDEDGFALIMHENEDDHMTQPIGGAGGRIACAAFND